MPATFDRRVRPGLAYAAAVLLLAAGTLGAQQPARSTETSLTTRAPLDRTRLTRIDTVVAEAIAARQIPGAVVVVGRGDSVAWRKAYGQRAVQPQPELMTVDTIFDLASLTKVLATAPAVMALIEDGRIRLSDTAATFIPAFAAAGKERITVRDLMTHMSGLRPDLDLTTDWRGHDEAVRRAAAEVPAAPPGQQFVYSDINYLVLAEIVARVSGQPFETFVAGRVLEPLKMDETTFRPPAAWRPRIAPTEPPTLRGTVHDPTARRMDGVAGHAGLFGTADDLVRFCRMMLSGGVLEGTRVLSPLTIARMTAPATPPGAVNVRGLGWDLDSSYSSNRGDLLPLGSYGHTGFTGTSIWIDPATGVFVIVLTNRVHPDGTGNVTALRTRIATIAAAAVIDPPRLESLTWPRPAAARASPADVLIGPPVSTGIDVLRQQQFAPLAGLRIGLVTNHTGRARDGAATIDLLAKAPNVTLVSLFSPEHGIRGILDAAVPSTFDDRTNLPIHSLYGATQRPTAAMLAGLDALVIDLQDVGTRFYTYMTTMAYVMEAAAERKLKVFVLDRPNPIGGSSVEGPLLDESAAGFTGYFSAMPIRHGLTLGELARVFNAERKIGADLTVVPMTGWQRDAWFDETGLAWTNPSPNMRSLYAATLYPGLGAFERTNLSVGRGTDTPFEHVGAPWIDGSRLAAELNRRAIPGVRVYPVSFTPTSSVYANQLCQGVFVVITDREAVRPVRVGVEVAAALWRLYPSNFDLDKAGALFASADGVKRMKAGDDPAAIADGWSDGETRWRQLTTPYLLYR